MPRTSGGRRPTQDGVSFATIGPANHDFQALLLTGDIILFEQSDKSLSGAIIGTTTRSQSGTIPREKTKMKGRTMSCPTTLPKADMLKALAGAMSRVAADTAPLPRPSTILHPSHSTPIPISHHRTRKAGQHRRLHSTHTPTPAMPIRILRSIIPILTTSTLTQSIVNLKAFPARLSPLAR